MPDRVEIDHTPCPFCAGEGEPRIQCHIETNAYAITCKGCGARAGWAETEGAAWMLWDIRVREPGRDHSRYKPQSGIDYFKP